MAERPAIKRAAGAARRLALAAAAVGAILGAPAWAETTVATATETAPPFVLVAFGDSLIAGYGLPIEDGFAPQLERWLDAQGAGPVTVVNAGVSGDTTSGGLARLDWSIGPEADAVLLELGANDALRGVDPAIARANLDRMLARLGERGLPVLLAGMYAPRNWGDEYVAAFEAIYPELSAAHGVPLHPFFLEGVVGEPALIQDDGLHPNADGVARLVAAIGPKVLELMTAARTEPSPPPS